MRLFIAIMLPEEAGKKILKFADELKLKGVTGRFVPLENLHLTLAFIGEYNDINHVAETVNTIDFEPFSIRLNDWTVDRKGILKVIPEENEALAGLAESIRTALISNGIYCDSRSFAPHVTVSRRSTGFPDMKYTDIDMDIDFDVEMFSLMQSVQAQYNSSYTRICSFVYDK